MKDSKLIKKCEIFLLQEKLDIIAKVEAGEKPHQVSRFYSIDESTVCNMVKCKDVSGVINLGVSGFSLCGSLCQSYL